MREKEEEEGTVPGPVKVKHFISVELTDDGNDVLVTIWHFKDAGPTVLKDRVPSGLVQTTALKTDDALQVNALRILEAPRESRAAIEATGTWLSNGAPGMLTLLVQAALMPGMIEGLRQYLQGEPTRSEERRVGKECRSRWSPY